jgi:hypothetical protein
LLVGTGAGIQPNNDPATPWRYIDGEHRVAAHFEQGVRRTVIQRFELLDLATGQPIE